LFVILQKNLLSGKIRILSFWSKLLFGKEYKLGKKKKIQAKIMDEFYKYFFHELLIGNRLR
jgi:hypothetical protein